MGCASSKTDRFDTLQNVAPRPHPGGGFPPEPALDRNQLSQALGFMAQYISQHSRKPITIIAVGGVVNTISLRSRDSTHDVDWFNNGLDSNQVMLLKKAANYALQQSKDKNTDIAQNWFNNKTMLFIPPNLRQELVQESFRQNYEVFSAPGLRVIAAPWGYALMTKLDRMAGGGGKPYDHLDAANYLHQYLRQIRKPAVSIRVIQQLAQKYHLKLKVEDARVVSRAHQAKFGGPGIVK